MIVPCYNHADVFIANLQRYEAVGLHLVLIDDGGSAADGARLTAIAEQNEWITLIRHARNTGKGTAVVDGIRRAADMGFTHALQIDADGQHDIESVGQLWATARHHPDCVVVGDPVFDATIPRSRLVGRYLTHFWVAVNTLRFDIGDSMCGFRAYPVQRTLEVANRCQLGERMDFDTHVLVRLIWDGADIVNQPVTVTYPRDGTSNFQMLRDNVDISLMHAKLFLGMLVRSPLLFWRLIARSRR